MCVLCVCVDRLAYVTHSGGGASVFVDGERVVRVSAAAERHVAVLCDSHRVEAGALAPALRESPEVRELVEHLIKRDVLWAEL